MALISTDRDRLTRIASKLDPRDFEGFANQCGQMNTVLGYQVEWHVRESDGVSPDLVDWVSGTVDDYNHLDPQHNMSREDVFAWMGRHYGD